MEAWRYDLAPTPPHQREFEDRVIGDPEGVAESLALDSGFNLADWPTAPAMHPRADDLATRLLWRALKNLSVRIPASGLEIPVAGRTRRLRQPDPSQQLPRDEIVNLSAARNGGIPLAYKCSADEGWANWKTSMLAFARADPEMQDDRARVLRQLGERMELESILWKAAGDDCGGRIPFAIARRTLDFCWDGDPDGPGPPAAFPCLRCGRWENPTRRTRNNPLCDYCRDKKVYTADGTLIVLTDPTTWPAHAIMPALRGTWWIECDYPGCSLVVEGRQQRHRCPVHPDQRLSRGRRRPHDPRSSRNLVAPATREGK